jgi:Holliday junction DNA helicase RuvB
LGPVDPFVADLAHEGRAVVGEGVQVEMELELAGGVGGGVAPAPDGVAEIARRARGTPRIAGRLLRRVLDFALVEGDGTLTRAIADRALTRLGVDQLGLDGADRRYLTLIAEAYQGGPVGVETLSAALSESRDAIEEVIEPYLLQQGLIQRSPRGRMLASRAWTHLGLAPPSRPEADLFK